MRLLTGFAAALILAFVQVWREGGLGTGDSGRGDLPETISGQVRVIDADSFRVGRHEVRLVGIDALEGRQDCERDGRSWPCGEEATRRLAAFVGRRDIVCAVEKVDQHGRLLSVCRLDATDINRWLVAEGWAVSYGRYGDAERAAKSGRKGIWSGTFERPRDWRDRNNRG